MQIILKVALLCFWVSHVPWPVVKMFAIGFYEKKLKQMQPFLTVTGTTTKQAKIDLYYSICQKLYQVIGHYRYHWKWLLIKKKYEQEQEGKTKTLFTMTGERFTTHPTSFVVHMHRVRTGLPWVRSEPGHRTRVITITSLLTTNSHKEYRRTCSYRKQRNPEPWFSRFSTPARTKHKIQSFQLVLINQYTEFSRAIG